MMSIQRTGFMQCAAWWCVLVWVTLGIVVARAGEYGDFTYEVTNSVVTIARYTGSEAHVTVPELIDGLPVTTVKEYAFIDTASLETVAIPGSVGAIGRSAFSDCRRLAEVNLAEGLVSIGDYAFSGSLRLSSVSIPATVTSIGTMPFLGCRHLLAIEVAPGNHAYRSIDGVVFNGTGSILLQYPLGGGTGYSVPAGVTEIADRAFSGCGDLTWVTLPEGLTRIGEQAFSYCEQLTEVTIPASVRSVGPRAFQQCQSLSALVIPEGVRELGERAFSSCKGLVSVRLPESLTTLGDAAFSGCTQLRTIDVDQANPIYSGLEGVLFSSSTGSTFLEQYPAGRAGEYSIPSGVTSIRKNAFSDCVDLTGVTIPEGVVEVGDYAFCGCAGLAAVAIPEGVTDLGRGVFSGCTALTQLTLPDTLRSVGEYAFSGCKSLVDVTFPNSSTMNLGRYAFVDCTALRTVAFPSNVSSSVDMYAFRGCTALASLEFPPEGTIFLKLHAFYGCTALTRVTLPRSVVAVDGNTFAYCSNVIAYEVDPEHRWYASQDGVLFNKDLTELLQYPAGREGPYAIPEGVRVVYEAFTGSQGLTRLSLPQSVTGFGGSAVDGCPNLTAIEVDPLNLQFSGRDGVLFNKDGTYLVRCPDGKVGAVEVPASVHFLGYLDRGQGVTAIEVDPENPSYSSVDGVLYSKDQTQLIRHPPGKSGTFTVPTTVTRIENGAFIDCANLTSITVEAGIKTLAYRGFEGCTQLNKIVLPASLVRTDTYAFYGCPNLNGIYFGGDLPSLYYALDEPPFKENPAVVLYYRPGTFFWEPFVFDRPTAPWVDPPVYADWLATTDLPSRYPASAGESDDPDQDGMSNYAEMLAGTDPVDVDSALVMEQRPRADDLAAEDRVPLEAGQYAVHFRSIPGKRYGVQWAESTDGPWHTEEVVLATTSQKRAVVVRPAGIGFYRVMLAQ